MSSVTPSSSASPEASSSTTGSAAASANTEVTSLTTISSLDDLKQKAPKVYNLMMQSIGMQICQKMQDDQAKLKEAWNKINNPGS